MRRVYGQSGNPEKCRPHSRILTFIMDLKQLDYFIHVAEL